VPGTSIASTEERTKIFGVYDDLFVRVEVEELTSHNTQILDSGMAKAHCLKPMDCLAVTKLPEGPQWSYELKLDGYRMQAIKSAGKVSLRSRREASYTKTFSLFYGCQGA